MANHNYLPHDGIATITELIEANTKGCPMISSSQTIC